MSSRNPPRVPGDCADASTSTVRKEGSGSIWDNLKKLATASARKDSCERGNMEEFRLHPPEPTCSKNKDPFTFRKEKAGGNFPGLRKLATKYLAIPAASVSSEKLFSIAGNIATSRREELTPDRGQQLLFLDENL